MKISQRLLRFLKMVLNFELILMEKIFFYPSFPSKLNKKLVQILWWPLMNVSDIMVQQKIYRRSHSSNSRRAVSDQLKSRFNLLRTRPQRLYGVIQGGMFRIFVKWGTEYASLSLLRYCAWWCFSWWNNWRIQQMKLRGWWMFARIQTNGPRHLLGISTFDDVLYGVKQGVDTFDCILPSRCTDRSFIYKTGEKWDWCVWQSQY